MITYQEKKRLVSKIIFIIFCALIVISIIRVLTFYPSSTDFFVIYHLIFKELFLSLVSAIFIMAVLYFFIEKEIRNVNSKAVSFAFTDALTGLKNRHYLNDFLEKFNSMGKEDSTFAVVFIDIDRFKLVNDTLGHSTGDCILKNLAISLRSLIRPGDTLCRYGGEEFVIIFCDIIKEDALRKVEQIRESIQRKTFECKGQKVTISAGVSFGTRDDDISEVMECSDKALYMAKDAGRNCIKVFTS
ncbi:MAG: diguanylate cyclase (GGDEF)-like protein [Sulfurimonas sp.]|jgi:diguanylate cyclase (GGDEF)-like protein